MDGVDLLGVALAGGGRGEAAGVRAEQASPVYRVAVVVVVEPEVVARPRFEPDGAGPGEETRREDGLPGYYGLADS